VTPPSRTRASARFTTDDYREILRFRTRIRQFLAWSGAQARAAGITPLRAAGPPPLPARMEEELAANPFLRAPDEASFADLRAQKDRF
jgi:hypothetical protein